jgi:hypothetical protein
LAVSSWAPFGTGFLSLWLAISAEFRFFYIFDLLESEI